MYLYRILALEGNDPVFVMFENMKMLSDAGEPNWWSHIQTLLKTYNITENLEQMKQMKHASFRTMVNCKISEVALGELLNESEGLKKTSTLKYDSLQVQGYLQHLYPNQARVVFKCRCQTMDIKTHLTYKYSDKICRGCGKEEETLSHVINKTVNHLPYWKWIYAR